MITDRWQALRRDALRRSGGRCQCSDCGGHVGQCGARLHDGPGGYEADHILPRSRGGPDVSANLRATCPECNRRKGARVTTLPDGPLRRALVATYITAARLARVGLPTAPLPPIIAPHVVTWRMSLLPGHAHVTTAATAEARAAAGHHGARVYVHGAELRVEVPRTPRRTVPLASMPQWGLGLDTRNQPVCIDLDRAPGVLVVGQTGSGKSTIIQSLVYHVARTGGRLIIVDPKYRAGGAALRPFRRLAALECAVANADGAGDALALAMAMMDARTPGERHPMLAVVVDEIQELSVGERATVERLAKLGREVNVQVIVTTQHPTRDVVTNALKNQLTWWIAGRVENASASTLVIGHTGAQTLGGRGDVIVANGGRESRIQAAIGGPADWAKLAQLEAEPAPAPRQQRTADARYRREPNDERVAWLVERYEREGKLPTQYALNRAFGGASSRNARAAAEASQALGLAS